MQRELELKYSSLTGEVPETEDLIATLAPLGLGVMALGTRLQEDDYYDTATESLQRASLALRVRTVAANTVVGIKSRGDAVAGLNEREELEVSGGSAAWPPQVVDRLAGVADLAAVAIHMHLVTERTAFLLYRADQGAGHPVAELAFDDVTCKLPASTEPESEVEASFSEVEIEALGTTNANELRAIGDALAALLPLVAGSASKLERATALIAPFR